jgi:[lysine-biosynthesis-protein LysW]--L-2-aminoadipate ligase
MRIGLLCSRIRVEEKLLRDALVHRGLEVEVVDDRELTLTLAQPVRRWDAVLERSISQTRALAVTSVLESWGIPTVNRHAVAVTCASKLATSAALEAAGVPTPATSRGRAARRCRAGVPGGAQARDRVMGKVAREGQ